MRHSCLVIERTRPLRGRVSVPGDKSISHRAVILGSLAHGDTVISSFLFGADCLSTIECLRKMGAGIEIVDGAVVIHGQGPCGLAEPTGILDVGNSGTTMRLLAGVLAGMGHYAVLTGDASIRHRPMRRVVEPLRQMGAVIIGRKGGDLAPITVLPQHRLHGIHYNSPVASAQVKSCILLAGLFAEGETSVVEPSKSRDHTERMLRYFGVPVKENGNTVSIQGGSVLRGTHVLVPGDFSAAAFILAAAALIPDSKVTVVNVGLNPTRTGFLDVLAQMGARVQVKLTRCGSSSDEPIGDITVEYSQLAGIEIGGNIIPRLIDEIPIIAVLAACADGRTRIRDAQELRFKESDRIDTMCRCLAKFGVETIPRPDGMEIVGTRSLACPTEVDSYMDHRVAMSVSVLAARAVLSSNSPIAVTGASLLDVSFPSYVEVMKSLGVEMRVAELD